MTKRRPSSGIYLFFGVGLLVGVGLAWHGVTVLRKQEASIHWPTVSGTIMQSKLRRVPNGIGYSRSLSRSYLAAVTYSYRVNGEGYLSGQITLWSADLGGYNDFNQTFVANHPEGTTVTVFYDPTDPGNAVLIPGANEKIDVLPIAVGLGFSVMGILGVVECFRERSRLAAVWSAPDAQTRTVRVKKSDVERAWFGLKISGFIGIGFLVLAVFFLVGPLSSSPSGFLETAYRINPWQVVFAIACIGGFVYFLWLGIKGLRDAECTACRITMDKTIFSTHKCNNCGTRIIFEDKDPATGSSHKV